MFEEMSVDSDIMGATRSGAEESLRRREAESPRQRSVGV